MAHNQEVVGSNPGTAYWMDVSKLLAITLKKIGNKVSQMWHPKNIFTSNIKYIFTLLD
jgi:hypothetical protein